MSFLSVSWFKRTVMVCTVPLLTACGAMNIFTGDDGRYDPTPLKEFPAAVSATIAWQVPVGSGSGVGFAPAIVNDSVYAAAADGSVGKFDLKNGASVWLQKLDLKLTAGVGSDGNVTAVAANDGTVVAFDDTGAEKWRAKATSDVFVPPVVGYGIVAVRSGDYRIQGFNAQTGERLWSIQRPGPSLALRGTSKMIAAEGLLITGVPGGKMIAVNMQTGDIQWEGVVAAAKGSTDLERVTDVTGSPILTGSLLCAASYQGRVICFDVSQRGRPVWGKDYSSPNGISVDANAVYSGDQKGVITAFGMQNGAQSWTQDALKYRKPTTPVSNGKYITVGDYKGYVHILSATDGKMVGRIAVGGDAMIVAPQVTSQGMLLQLGNGSLALIALN